VRLEEVGASVQEASPAAMTIAENTERNRRCLPIMEHLREKDENERHGMELREMHALMDEI
jgi:hypothetical protein